MNGVNIDLPALNTGNRKKMKTLNIPPNEDINLDLVIEILNLSVQLSEKIKLEKLNKLQN